MTQRITRNFSMPLLTHSRTAHFFRFQILTTSENNATLKLRNTYDVVDDILFVVLFFKGKFFPVTLFSPEPFYSIFLKTDSIIEYLYTCLLTSENTIIPLPPLSYPQQNFQKNLFFIPAWSWIALGFYRVQPEVQNNWHFFFVKKTLEI